MGRRPRLNVLLRIEGLSDGREVRAQSFTDDFTGEVLPVAQDERLARVLLDGFTLREREQRARLAAKRALLESVMQRVEAKAIAKRNQIPVHSTNPKPSWRRW